MSMRSDLSSSFDGPNVFLPTARYNNYMEDASDVGTPQLRAPVIMMEEDEESGSGFPASVLYGVRATSSTVVPPTTEASIEEALLDESDPTAQGDVDDLGGGPGPSVLSNESDMRSVASRNSQVTGSFDVSLGPMVGRRVLESEAASFTSARGAIAWGDEAWGRLGGGVALPGLFEPHGLDQILSAVTALEVARYQEDLRSLINALYACLQYPELALASEVVRLLLPYTAVPSTYSLVVVNYLLALAGPVLNSAVITVADEASDAMFIEAVTAGRRYSRYVKQYSLMSPTLLMLRASLQAGLTPFEALEHLRRDTREHVVAEQIAVNVAVSRASASGLSSEMSVSARSGVSGLESAIGAAVRVPVPLISPVVPTTFASVIIPGDTTAFTLASAEVRLSQHDSVYSKSSNIGGALIGAYELPEGDLTIQTALVGEPSLVFTFRNTTADISDAIAGTDWHKRLTSGRTYDVPKLNKYFGSVNWGTWVAPVRPILNEGQKIDLITYMFVHRFERQDAIRQYVPTVEDYLQYKPTQVQAGGTTYLQVMNMLAQL